MDLVLQYVDRGSQHRWNVATGSISGMLGNNAQLYVYSRRCGHLLLRHCEYYLSLPGRDEETAVK
jgi:hypothetical protein